MEAMVIEIMEEKEVKNIQFEKKKVELSSQITWLRIKKILRNVPTHTHIPTPPPPRIYEQIKQGFWKLEVNI